MMKNSNRYLLAIFMVLGFIYLRSSYGKISGGVFVSGLGETLGKMASKNPYPAFKSFLEGVAIPNSTIFGQLTMWGELFAGLTLLIGSLILFFGKNPNRWVRIVLIMGLLVGAFLNGIFWLASGYTSPSTDGLNLVMFAVQVVGIMYLVRGSK